VDEDRAEEHLTAELEPARATGPRKALRWGLALVEAAFGSVPDDPDLDLVVRRRDTGAEVLRTHADIASPEHLLATVRDDLATKSVTEFVAEWRQPG
jgi:hypothetical protein